jgi:hypothetical protein
LKKSKTKNKNFFLTNEKVKVSIGFGFFFIKDILMSSSRRYRLEAQANPSRRLKSNLHAGSSYASRR